ncbi:hypothetical protein KI688_004223 [Linnemannia hyalina]|uniref:Uncharacterized protein n=1 Tax=Linnemannia hyalina TaxID=64524 RepID=A0A9P8BPW9_9FUNG|nr:hypothetical protein KI688_004223 [Linnemannia hyalina]
MDLSSYAIDLSQMRYSDAQDSILDRMWNRDVKKLLNSLLAEDFLWKGADFNELKMVKHLFDPFLKTRISNLKKTGQKKVLHIDLEKVAFLLKDAIDDMARHRVDVAKLKVFGMVMIGTGGVIYSMQPVAGGIYLMKNYALVYAPQFQFDLCVVAGAINTFLNLREELVTAMEIFRASRLDKPTNLTMPSFGTPIRGDDYI